MVGRGYSTIGYPIAYIGVKIYNDKVLRNILAYLHNIDETIYGKKEEVKEIETVQDVQNVQVQTKKKSNNRKKK